MPIRTARTNVGSSNRTVLHQSASAPQVAAFVSPIKTKRSAASKALTGRDTTRSQQAYWDTEADVHRKRNEDIRTQEIVAHLRDNVAAKYHTVKDMFRHLDDGNIGELGVPDFHKGTKELHLDVTPKEMNDLFKRADLDGNGVVDFDEFAKLFTARRWPIPEEMSPSSESLKCVDTLYQRISAHQAAQKTSCDNAAKLQNAIRRYDPVGSALISRGDFTKVAEDLRMGYSPHEMKALLQACDPGNRGTIRYRELLRELQHQDIQCKPSEAGAKMQQAKHLQWQRKWCGAGAGPATAASRPADPIGETQNDPHFRATTPYTSMAASAFTTQTGRQRLDVVRAQAAVEANRGGGGGGGGAGGGGAGGSAGGLKMKSASATERAVETDGGRPSSIRTSAAAADGAASQGSGAGSGKPPPLSKYARANHSSTAFLVGGRLAHLTAGGSGSGGSGGGSGGGGGGSGTGGVQTQRPGGGHGVRTLPVERSSIPMIGQGGSGTIASGHTAGQSEQRQQSQQRQQRQQSERACDSEYYVPATGRTQRRGAAGATGGVTDDVSDDGRKPRPGGKASTRYVVNRLGRAVPDWTFGEGTHEAVRGTAAHAEDRERLQTTADLEAERVVRAARRRRAEAKQRGLDDFAEASASGAAARAAAAARGGGPVDGTAHARRIHAYVRAVKERDQGQQDQGGAAAQLPASVGSRGEAGRGAGRDSAARAGASDSAATAGAGAGAGSSSTCRLHEAKGAQAQAYAYAKLHGEAPPEAGRPSEAEARRRRHGQRLAAHEQRVGGAYEQEELRRRAAADRRVMEKAQQSLEYHQVRGE
jgi:Ca2+-binding EF-hand superfamily protein